MSYKFVVKGLSRKYRIHCLVQGFMGFFEVLGHVVWVIEVGK